MAEEFWLLGGDDRSRYSAEHLENHGFEVKTYGIPHKRDWQLPKIFRQVILPFPSFQGSLLRGHSAVPVEELLCRIGEGTKVFGGLLAPWQAEIEKQGGKVCDLYGSEPLTTRNAALTVEGAVCLAVSESTQALLGAICLVIGYGRIGKLLAQRLNSFAAKVTVAARKEADLAAAEALGLRTDRTGQYFCGLGQYDFIFNTVPASVLSAEQLQTLSSHCLLMDLASAPGGFSTLDCAQLGLKSVNAAALPGRFSPQSAGALYAQSILDLTLREEVL